MKIPPVKKPKPHIIIWKEFLREKSPKSKRWNRAPKLGISRAGDKKGVAEKRGWKDGSRKSLWTLGSALFPYFFSPTFFEEKISLGNGPFSLFLPYFFLSMSFSFQTSYTQLLELTVLYDLIMSIFICTLHCKFCGGLVYFLWSKCVNFSTYGKRFCEFFLYSGSRNKTMVILQIFSHKKIADHFPSIFFPSFQLIIPWEELLHSQGFFLLQVPISQLSIPHSLLWIYLGTLRRRGKIRKKECSALFTPDWNDEIAILMGRMPLFLNRSTRAKVENAQGLQDFIYIQGQKHGNPARLKIGRKGIPFVWFFW